MTRLICRLFGHRWTYVEFFSHGYHYCCRCGRVA